MPSLFSPAVALMLKLKYRQKFVLVGLVLIIPTALLMTAFLVQTNKDFTFAANEKAGLPAIHALLNLLSDVQEHRVNSFSALSGVIVSADSITQNEQQITSDMASVTSIFQQIAPPPQMMQKWTTLQAFWASLHDKLASMGLSDNFDNHTQISNDITALINDVGNTYNLILDPQLDTYYLSYLTINSLSKVAEDMSQLRAYGIVVASQQKLSEPDKSLLPVLNGLARRQTDEITRGIGYIDSVNPTAQAQIDSAFSDYQNNAKYYLNIANGRIIAAIQINNQKTLINATDYGKASLAALKSVSKLSTVLIDALSSLLQSRLDSLNLSRAVAIFIVIMTIALSIYLFNAFYIAVSQTINTLDIASKQMVTGQFTGLVKLDSTDELAQIVASFNSVAQALVMTNQQLEAQKSDLETANKTVQEASRLKSEFISTMSHELRTPLNAIIGFTGVMLMGIDGVINERARYMIERVESNSKRLLALINDILDISKIEAGRMELIEKPVVLRQMIDGWHKQIDVLSRQKELVFLDEIDPNLPPRVLVDRDRYTQIAINLLSNAVKFTEQGSVRLILKRQDESLVMQVIDTGIGIPPHAIGYIFDEFRQVDGSSMRAFGGTGLGLAIVRNLARIMAGKVSVESKVGQGSTFIVTIPLKSAPDENTSANPENAVSTALKTKTATITNQDMPAQSKG